MELQFRRIGVALAATLLVLGAASSAQAAGTAAGTSVSNSAVVSFSVQGVGQTPIESSVAGNSTPGAGAPTVFTVDRKIDILVTENVVGYADQWTSVRPDANDQVLAFTVENEGNEVQDLLLTAVDGSGNTITLAGTARTDNFDGTTSAPPSIWLDNGDLVFDRTTDTEIAYLDGLAPDTPQTVFVVRDIPADRVDGDVSIVTLDAQAVANSGTPASPGAPLVEDTGPNVLVDATPQIVFADDDGTATQGTDGLRDGRHSASDGYLVESAQLTIRKTAVVVSDPFGNGPPNAKAIPGSIVEYEIRVENSGTATETASAISISDDLTSEMSGAVGGARLLFVDDAYGLPASNEDIQLETNQSGATVTSTLTRESDAPTDNGQFVSDVLTVTGIVLEPGEFATVRFQVEIL